MALKMMINLSYVVSDGQFPRDGYSQLSEKDLLPTSLSFCLLSIIPFSERLSKGYFLVHPPFEARVVTSCRGLEAEAGRRLIGRRGALCEERIRPRDDT